MTDYVIILILILLKTQNQCLVLILNQLLFKCCLLGLWIAGAGFGVEICLAGSVQGSSRVVW